MSCVTVGDVYCLVSTVGKVLEICILYIPDAPSGMLKLMVSPASQMKIKAFSLFDHLDAVTLGKAQLRAASGLCSQLQAGTGTGECGVAEHCGPTLLLEGCSSWDSGCRVCSDGCHLCRCSGPSFGRCSTRSHRWRAGWAWQTSRLRGGPLEGLLWGLRALGSSEGARGTGAGVLPTQGTGQTIAEVERNCGVQTMVLGVRQQSQVLVFPSTLAPDRSVCWQRFWQHQGHPVVPGGWWAAT